MTYDVEIGGRRASVSVRRHADGGWWVAIDGAPAVHVNGQAAGPAEWWLQDADGRRRVALAVNGSEVAAQVGGHGVSGTVVDPRRTALTDAVGGALGAIVTPMPGAVVRIPVQVGQAVGEGQVLVVVEAMKMENEFKSPIAGVVAAVHVDIGAALDAHTLLVTVEPAEQE